MSVTSRHFFIGQLKFKTLNMRRLLQLAFLSFGLLLFGFSGLAQERPISGKITGDDGTPLTGVTVSIKGTDRATQTDAEGRFTISAQTGQTLHFSYVGYTAQEAVVGEGNTVSVKLATLTNNSLEDVVVVGYSTQKRGNLT